MIMRLLDVLYAIPGILLAIAIIAAFGANTMNLIIALSVGSIPTYATDDAGECPHGVELRFRRFGTCTWYVGFVDHLQTGRAEFIGTDDCQIDIDDRGAVIATSSLSYLGLGVEPHIPEWGNILRVGSTYLESHSYLAIFPGLAIILLSFPLTF